MGQNQSSEKEKPSRGTDRDRKVNRRTSVPVLPKNATQSDASANTVAAQGTTTHHLDMTNLEKMLQSQSPEHSAKPNRGERSSSRKKKEAEAHQIPQATPVPVAEREHQKNPVNGIDIPSSSVLPTRSRQRELEDNSPYETRNYMPVSHHRPPRLPLPIAEAPDSPSLGPVVKDDEDMASLPLDRDDVGLRKVDSNSVMSVVTQDDAEDVGEELQPFGVGPAGQTVPCTIEWNQNAKQVFVTGTFAAWDRKYRLKKRESREGFKTVINLPPGTHHLKFFVDNNMVTSPDLPTAVDFNNILVNYIEISTDDIPKARRESGQMGQKPLSIQQPHLDSSAEQPEQYSGTVTPGEGDAPSDSESGGHEEMPEGDFRQVVPPSLFDLELEQDDPRYKYANQVISELPQPPSLPLFLSRSILNAGTNLPIKDDASVLAMPNHTVLNHLMTSNVRNGVLATSVTTRYKKKYITTISFKPVPKPLPSVI